MNLWICFFRHSTALGCGHSHQERSSGKHPEISLKQDWFHREDRNKTLGNDFDTFQANSSETIEELKDISILIFIRAKYQEVLITETDYFS